MQPRQNEHARQCRCATTICGGIPVVQRRRSGVLALADVGNGGSRVLLWWDLAYLDPKHSCDVALICGYYPWYFLMHPVECQQLEHVRVWQAVLDDQWIGWMQWVRKRGTEIFDDDGSTRPRIP